MNRGRALQVVVAVAAALLVPALAAAHPLGNFTINHYAGVRVSSTAIAIDAVIDHAEIPAFQARQRIDTDGDGSVSAVEQEAERLAACPRLASDLRLALGGAPLGLTPVAAGLWFPAGAGGLPTMRLVCEFQAEFGQPLTAGSPLTFADGSYADRIGWREIVVIGDGVTVSGAVPTGSGSERLTAYPESLLNTPPDVRNVSVTIAPGGPAAPAFVAPDASALSAAATVPAGVGTSVPGGVGGEIAGLLRTQDLTPLVLLASLLAAAALGAGHALTPGHGKTIMAAFLVGSRGSARHALGLGLATAVSHTLGVVGLGVLILAAGSALPAERIFPVLSLVSALLVVGIGIWLVWRQAPVLARLVRRPALVPVTVGAGVGHGHVHGNEGDHGHSHGLEPEHGHGHAHPHPHSHPHPHPGPGDGPIGWRTLFALGLSGGLVPSTSALLILVATVATGRPAFGLLLVFAFGLGMAAVLVGIGLALVLAGDRLSQIQNRPGLTRALELAPAIGAIVVLGLGVVLTAGAVTGAPVL